PSGSSGRWPETYARLPRTRTQRNGYAAPLGLRNSSARTRPSSATRSSIVIALRSSPWNDLGPRSRSPLELLGGEQLHGFGVRGSPARSALVPQRQYSPQPAVDLLFPPGASDASCGVPISALCNAHPERVQLTAIQPHPVLLARVDLDLEPFRERH